MIMKNTKQFLGEFEELVLLAILKIGKDAYGVPIAKAIEEASGRSVSTGALYTTLSRLEEKNFISSRMGEKTEERGGRAKKIFSNRDCRQTGASKFIGGSPGIRRVKFGICVGSAIEMEEQIQKKKGKELDDEKPQQSVGFVDEDVLAPEEI